MDKILEEVKNKHGLVLSRGVNVLFTALVGSQNYGLATEASDVDTYSFVLPSYDNFLLDKKIPNYEIQLDDGSKACVKDIRLFCHLLKQSNPNSIECILSNYIIFNPDYEEVLKEYLYDDTLLYYIVHCNSSSMLNAIAGTILGLHGRNMTPGKKYSHMIRLMDLCNKYIDKEENIRNYLKLYDEDIELARSAKAGNEPHVTEEFCVLIAKHDAVLIDDLKLRYKPNKSEEAFGQMLIDNMQCAIMSRFLELNGWTRK